MQQVQQEYDQLASQYDRSWSRYIAATTRRTAAVLELGGDERFLDVGCGTGALLEYVRAQVPGARLVGCDLSEEMLRVARSRRPPQMSLVNCDVQELPFAAATFDAAASASSLHYWLDPSHGAAEIARVLRPGGSFVLTDWSGDYLRSRLLGFWLRLRRKARVRTYRAEEISRLLEAAGFRIEWVERYAVGWFWRMVIIRARLEIG